MLFYRRIASQGFAPHPHTKSLKRGSALKFGAAAPHGCGVAGGEGHPAAAVSLASRSPSTPFPTPMIIPSEKERGTRVLRTAHVAHARVFSRLWEGLNLREGKDGGGTREAEEN